MKYYMINGAGKDINPQSDSFFTSFEDALAAWMQAGSPTQRGSSVWITEMEKDYMNCFVTLRTITLSKRN